VDEQVHVLPLCPQSTNKLKKWGGAVFMLRKNIKRYKPDVVIGNMHLCSSVSRIAAVGTHTPVVMTIHHALASEGDIVFSKTEKFMDRYSPSIYAATVVLTEADKEVMNNKYHQKKNIIVMPNPLTFTPIVVTEDGEMINTQGEKVIKEKIIFAAGRLNDWKCKGWDLLIKAWALINGQWTMDNGQFDGQSSALLGWRLQIAGTGSEQDFSFLKQLCKENDVEDSVEFLGYRTDMKELYQKASIYCLSSRSEGLPMVLIEAMSQGCAPVACENLGRTREIITNDDEGLLFKTANIDDLAKQLSRMITDSGYRKKVQRASVERSYFYQTDHIVEMWEELLKK
jgi:glycosyltransferase involved in cell wall biosynthesis